MAVQFISDLSTTKVLNAFNNNVVAFRSTSGTTSLDATISITGSLDAPTVTITPDSSGIFYYNFKELFKIISNKNHFRDDIYSGFSLPSLYIKQDYNVFKDLKATYTITLEDGNTETTSKSYRVLRSVIQLEDYRRSLTNAGNTALALLLPFTENSNKTHHATMFDGYPFDVAIYSSTFQNVVVKNKTTGYEITESLKRGVNRFFFSNGETNLTLEDILPIALGENEIEISLTGLSDDQNKLTLFLRKEEACQGHLLKWFNDFGGWCYFLFQENREEIKVKDIGDFTSDFKNIKDTQDNFTSLGYEKSKAIELFAKHINNNQKKIINTLFGSPKVYLYLNTTFQNAGENDFVAVKLNETKASDNFRYIRSMDYFFEISKPLINTLSM